MKAVNEMSVAYLDFNRNYGKEFFNDVRKIEIKRANTSQKRSRINNLFFKWQVIYLSLADKIALISCIKCFLCEFQKQILPNT